MNFIHRGSSEASSRLQRLAGTTPPWDKSFYYSAPRKIFSAISCKFQNRLLTFILRGMQLKLCMNCVNILNGGILKVNFFYKFDW